MLHEYTGELGGNWVYWSNAYGEIHRNGDFTYGEENLPEELRRAYDELWCDGYTADCYLVEFQGKFGVALQASYSGEFARSCGMTYRQMVGKAGEFAERYPFYEVVFGTDTSHWSDGSVESEVFIIIPWDEEWGRVKAVAEDFGSGCYLL